MVKEVRGVTSVLGITFKELSLLPGFTTKDCTIQNISLETKLAENLVLKIPFLSAAMQSVTGYEMALALGKEGGMGILPMGLSIKEQVSIIKKIKEHEPSFVKMPISVREYETVGEVIKKIEVYGHSRIPVVDVDNTFLGIFTLPNFFKKQPDLEEKVTNVMTPFSKDAEPYSLNEPVPYVSDNLSIEEVKNLFESNGHQRYLVLLDDLGRLRGLAFKKDIEKINIGSAISTHRGWKERVKENIEAGTDLIVIDTSDAYNEFTSDVIKDYKSMGIKIPICAGNIVTYEGARYLMEAGADIIKVGMSSGSMCTTKSQKAVGRAPMTALIEAGKARDDYYKAKQRYVPLIMDGGIENAADMIITLTIADGGMMGYYFNRFYEAVGEKFDENGNFTNKENEIRHVRIFGEGSKEAWNLRRYGHTPTTFFEEGVSGKVPYVGRLKPNLKEDLSKIKAALVNSGCMNLEEFRKNSVIELISPRAQGDLNTTYKIS